MWTNEQIYVNPYYIKKTICAFEISYQNYFVKIHDINKSFALYTVFLFQSFIFKDVVGHHSNTE